MEITYDLHFIKEQSRTKNNVYIIVDKETKRTAIVDPASSLKQINEIINRLGLILDIILVTHTHMDHINCIQELVQQHDCRVYVSKLEVAYYSYHCKNLEIFEEEDIIQLGGTWINCILTPGHTVGSACFLLEKSLFSGDTIFMEGCGVCTGKGGSASSMFHSISKIKQRVEDSVQVYSGHTYNLEPGKTLSYLKENNIYFVIKGEKEFVEFRNRKNQKNIYNFI